VSGDPLPAGWTAPLDPDRLAFRRLTDDDLVLLHRWLNEPGIVRWWEGDDVSWDGVLGRYSTASTADDSVEHHLGLLDGEPVGWIQCWFLADEPDMEDWLGLGFAAHDTAGIDYLIGSVEHRGHGLGTALIAAFVERVVFAEHAWIDAVGSDPDSDNHASWRALESAGFRQVAQQQAEGRTYRVMRRDRAGAVEAGTGRLT